MEPLALATPRVTSLTQCIDSVADNGWALWPGFLSADDTAALAAHTLAVHADGHFHRAGVGRASGLAIREGIRSDQVLWIDDAPPHPVLDHYREQMDQLREAINRALYLGLFDLESHLAVYPPGSAYERHLDRFRDDDRRTVTAVYYLNEAWQTEHGGALRLYLADETELDVLPSAGTLVLFISAELPHEVLPATRERLSLTGWFRRR